MQTEIEERSAAMNGLQKGSSGCKKLLLLFGLPVGCALSPFLLFAFILTVITVIIIAIIVSITGGWFNWMMGLPGNYTPGSAPQHPPIYGTPPPYYPPTLEPSPTAWPTLLPYLPPTAAIPPPVVPPPPSDCDQSLPPTEVPGWPAAATAVALDCARATAEAEGWQATATTIAGSYQGTQTAVASSWQATVTAAAAYRNATETVQVPTATPLPPLDGNGPYDAPISLYCDDFPGCAADSEHRRIVTQDYGCTTFPEYPSGTTRPFNPATAGFCQRANSRSDRRFNTTIRFDQGYLQPRGNPTLPDGWQWFHRAIDFDTGYRTVPASPPQRPYATTEGEPYYAMLDGRVKLVTIVVEGQPGWMVGAGTTMVIESLNHTWEVQYMHMSEMGEAIYLCDTPSPRFIFGERMGRPWQAGDCIRHIGAVSQRIMVGKSGHTGYTSHGWNCGDHTCDGDHAHNEIRYQGIDVDPWPFYTRLGGEPLPPTEVPYRYPGGGG